MPNKVERMHLTCLFAEDVRQEASGQVTLIGWFANGQLALPSAEARTLLKFCMAALLEVPRDLDIKTLAFQLRMKDQTLGSISVPPAVLAQALSNRPMTEGEEDDGLIIQMTMQMQNVTFPGPGSLRGFAVVNDQDVRGNSLKIVAPQLVQSQVIPSS